MRTVEIDREDEAYIRVTWMAGSIIRIRLFDSRDAAEGFAQNKAGATGCIISTLDMTAEQLAAHHARADRVSA